VSDPGFSGSEAWIEVLEADAPDPFGEAAEAEHPLVTTGEAMTLAQALTLSRRRDSRLVLLMGEPGTGKTSALAALWERLGAGESLAGHRLAGSRTALGFERRAHWGRIDSGQRHGRFPSTPTEDGFVLDLRIRRPDGELVELLLADLGGGVFEHIRQGRPLLQELPWAMRADRFVVALDAEALSIPGESEVAATRALRQLLALRSSGAVRATARVGIALTKADALSDAGERALARHEPNLLDHAAAVDPEPANVRIAASPEVEGPSGLGELLAWMCSDERRRQPEAPAMELVSDRATAGSEA
jgi:hypothetical protein